MLSGGPFQPHDFSDPLAAFVFGIPALTQVQPRNGGMPLTHKVNDFSIANEGDAYQLPIEAKIAHFIDPDAVRHRTSPGREDAVAVISRSTIKLVDSARFSTNDLGAV